MGRALLISPDTNHIGHQMTSPRSNCDRLDWPDAYSSQHKISAGYYPTDLNQAAESKRDVYFQYLKQRFILLKPFFLPLHKVMPTPF